jgi:hypothetical protein
MSENKRRKRYSVREMYSSSAEEIANLVIGAIKSYVKIEGMSKEAACERALADYMFCIMAMKKKEKNWKVLFIYSFKITFQVA